MHPIADISLNPGELIAWIVVGLVSGWLAGSVIGGGGYGIAGDIIAGLIGALVVGFLYRFFVDTIAGFLGSIVVAFIGACVWNWLYRMLATAQSRKSVFSVAALAVCACVSVARASISVPGFPSSPTSHAMSASADATIVVGYMESALGDEAILWRPTSGVLPVKDYLVGHGVTGLDGWDLTTATHISPDGQMFCGWALNPMGATAPWMAESLDADLNLDWRVNIFDLNMVSSNWGSSSAAGDANGDGTVNIFDINRVSSTWGQAGTFSTSMSTLPSPPEQTVEVAQEPASIGIWTLLASAALAFGWWRRSAR